MAQQQQQGGPPQGYGGAQPAKPPGRVLSILGFVFGGIAILFLPYIIGVAGIVCALVALNKGDPLAKWSLAVAVGGTLIGILLIVLILNAGGLI